MSLNPFECSFDSEVDTAANITTDSLSLQPSNADELSPTASQLLLPLNQLPTSSLSSSSSSSSPSTLANHSMPQFRIRRMHEEDVPEVLKIWEANNLHEGTYTIQSFLRVDPNGFFVAVEVEDANDDDKKKSKKTILIEPKSERKALRDDKMKEGLEGFGQTVVEFKKCKTRGSGKFCQDSSSTSSDSLDSMEWAKANQKSEGRILGMCSGVFIHPSIAFIGMYGVRPELHGRGIGMSMWRRMMNHIGNNNAGLYAVLEHLSMYRDRAGFKVPDSRLLFIYESVENLPPKIDLLVNSIRGIEVSAIGEQHYQMVAKYDAEIHGYPRHALLSNVFQEPDTAAFVALDLEDEECPVQGYGCIRTNNIGKAMIGPLYANNDAVAELLMRRLFESLAEPFARGLLYMTLDSNPGGERIADKLELLKQEELPRFFRVKPYKEAKWNQVYCIHTPNFSLL